MLPWYPDTRYCMATSPDAPLTDDVEADPGPVAGTMTSTSPKRRRVSPLADITPSARVVKVGVAGAATQPSPRDNVRPANI